MATYVVGDVQGCYDSLMALIERLEFAPARDQLWFVGDLVNRGPKSLHVLRWIRDLGDAAVTVLGNHDLHLLARAAGLRKYKSTDTLRGVLQARDSSQLLDWLRTRPLVHVDRNYLMVHAGLHPSWSPRQALSVASSVEKVLRADDWADKLHRIYGCVDAIEWDPAARGDARLKSAVAYLTRLRACRGRRAQMNTTYSGTLEELPLDLRAWFQYPAPARAGYTVVFGHWSALGLYRGHDVVCVDTGCVWGRTLTAMRLEDGAVFQQEARE